jgi:phosphotransferase system enzyme I (PtsI)
VKLIQGIGASEGIAIGQAYLYLPKPPPIVRCVINDPQKEIKRLEKALHRVDDDLEKIQARMEIEASAKDAEIFQAHRMFLSDPAFTGEIKRLIETEYINAEAAVEEVATNLRQVFEAMEDEYFRARSVDVIDVAYRLIRNLLNVLQPSLRDLPDSCIVIADELTPSDAAQMDLDKVIGFVTSKGGRTAHVAILARSLGLPAVVGAGEGLWTVQAGCCLILDGNDGKVIFYPDPKTIREYEQRAHGLLMRGEMPCVWP